MKQKKSSLYPTMKGGERTMKKVLVVVFALAFVLVATSASFAVIANSKHDLKSGTGYSGGTLSACQYCHTPHLRTNPVVTGAPLWNRSPALLMPKTSILLPFCTQGLSMKKLRTEYFARASKAL